MRRRMTMAVVLLAACAARAGEGGQAPGESAELDLEAVVARTTEAMGGAETLRGLRNLRLKPEWTEGGTEFRGDYRATRDGRMRIDVYVGGDRVFSEGIDARGAWEQPGEGSPVTEVGDAPRRALEHGIAYRFDGVWFARERGRELSLEEREVVDGVNYHVVKLRFADGFETHFYIHPGTWRIERQRDHRAYHPSSDPRAITVETVHDEFKSLCGAPFPSASHDVNLATGETLTRSRVKTGLCNLPESDLEIARPVQEAAP